MKLERCMQISLVDRIMTASLEWNISLVDRIIGSPLDEMEWWDVNRWFFNSFKFWLPFDSHNSWRCFWAYFLIYHCLLRLLWKRKAPKTTNRLWTGKKTAVSHNFQNPKLNTSFITQKCLWNLPLKRCVFFSGSRAPVGIFQSLEVSC